MSAAVISGNRLMDSEAKAKRNEAVSASPLGLCLFCGGLAQTADGITDVGEDRLVRPRGCGGGADRRGRPWRPRGRSPVAQHLVAQASCGQVIGCVRAWLSAAMWAPAGRPSRGCQDDPAMGANAGGDKDSSQRIVHSRVMASRWWLLTRELAAAVGRRGPRALANV